MRKPLECFPKLDLIGAKSAMERLLAPVCVFSLPRMMAGQLILTHIEDEHIAVNYIFAMKGMLSGECDAVFRTVVRGNPLDRYRRYWLCPRCNDARRNLYYAQSWSCAPCHGLLYRSQLVGKEVKLWEERDELDALLKAGRPKGMHNETYIQARLRLIALERRLYNCRRKVASDEHNTIVTHAWIPAAEIELWSSRYWVRNGFFERADY